MMNPMHPLRLACCALVLDATAASACTGSAQDVFSVGNKAADSSCTYATIQEAINNATCANGTKIILNQSGDYTHQHLTITDRNVTLVGRVDTAACSTLVAACGINFPCPVGPLRTIDASNTFGAVLTIRGASTVSLSHLTLTHGIGSNGGGIDFSGSGTLSLDNSTIAYNTAFGSGGGINLAAPDSSATLHVGANTTVSHNVAGNDGGGVRIDGIGASLDITGADVWINSNSAATTGTSSGYGGGIEIVDGSARIGSGYAGTVINRNSANYGAGIATRLVNLAPGLVLYTSNPAYPVDIDTNTAYQNGGGIYSEGPVCMTDFRLDGNVAVEGSALYLRSDADFGNPYAYSCGNLQGLGSVPCDPAQPCNTIHGNLAEDAAQGYAATDGSALRIFGSFSGNAIDVRANQGGYVLHMNGSVEFPQSPDVARLTNCVFAGNATAHELMLTNTGTTELRLTNCTLADDAIGADQVLSANDVLDVDDSIFAEGSKAASLFGASGSYNLSESPGLAGATVVSPVFVDRANGDYRLFYGLSGGKLVRSPGVDAAPATTHTYDPTLIHDLREDPRDLPVSSDPAGPRDLGAYEMQGVGDRLFIDTFGDALLLVH